MGRWDSWPTSIVGDGEVDLCVVRDGNRGFHGEFVGFRALDFGDVDGRSVGEVHACDAGSNWSVIFAFDGCK